MPTAAMKLRRSNTETRDQPALPQRSDTVTLVRPAANACTHESPSTSTGGCWWR
jgi:hypothetical protein